MHSQFGQASWQEDISDQALYENKSITGDPPLIVKVETAIDSDSDNEWQTNNLENVSEIESSNILIPNKNVKGRKKSGGKKSTKEKEDLAEGKLQ